MDDTLEVNTPTTNKVFMANSGFGFGKEKLLSSEKRKQKNHARENMFYFSIYVALTKHEK